MKRVILLILSAGILRPCLAQEPLPLLERAITLSAVNEPITQVLQKIEKQAGLFFSYNSDLFDGTRRITVTFQKESIEQVIRLLFDGKIKCKAQGDHVILTRNKKNPSLQHRPGDKIWIRDTVYVRDTVVLVIRDTVFVPAVGSSPENGNDGKNLQLGPVACVGLSGVRGINGTGFLLTAGGGVFLETALTKRLWLRPEIVFRMKGYNYSATETIPPILTTDAQQRYYYIEVPLLAKISITSQIGMIAGPYAGFLTGTYYSTSTSVNGILNHSEHGNNTRDFKSADIGAIVGLSFSINPFQIGLRYSKGFIPVSRLTDANPVTHFAFSAFLGYNFLK